MASSVGSAPGAPLPAFGKQLGQITGKDLTPLIDKAVNRFMHEQRQLDMVLFKEVLELMSRVDRVISSPGGSLLMAGRSGVGRRSAASVVANLHQMKVLSPKVTRGYGVKHFKNDLKQVMDMSPNNLKHCIC